MVSIASGVTTQTWKLLHDTVSGLVADPTSRSAPKKWIFSAFPDVTKKSFPGYPIIIIDSPDTMSTKATFTQSVYRTDSNISLYDTNIARADAVTGSLLRAFKTRNTSIHASGLTNTTITSSSSETIEVNGKKIHIKLFGLDFDVVNG